VGLALTADDGGFNVHEFVTGHGFDHAVTTYCVNGPIVPQRGFEDFCELIIAYPRHTAGQGRCTCSCKRMSRALIRI